MYLSGSDSKASACNAGACVQSLGGEDPLEKEMATHSSFLPGKPHGRRNLVGYSPWSHKELDTTEQLHFHFRVCVCVKQYCRLMLQVTFKAKTLKQTAWV